MEEYRMLCFKIIRGSLVLWSIEVDTLNATGKTETVEKELVEPSQKVHTICELRKKYNIDKEKILIMHPVRVF